MLKSFRNGLVEKERKAGNKVDQPAEENNLPRPVPLDGGLVAQRTFYRIQPVEIQSCRVQQILNRSFRKQADLEM